MLFYYKYNNICCSVFYFWGTTTFDDMRRVVSIIVLSLIFCCESAAQKAGDIGRIAAFLGVASEEELSDDEVERLGEFLRHPLKINLLSRSRLTVSGLFTGYQVASLMDYRQRHGEVLSFAELSLVDGFGKSYVELLKPFVSLDSAGLPGSSVSDTVRVFNELSLRGGYRYASDAQDWQYGLKYGLDACRGFKASVGLSRSRTAKTPAPSSYTASVSCDFRKTDLRLVVGDFNARFGQGLVAWNGVFISSLATPSGFMKKASGVSAVRSFTGSTANSGIAAEIGVGKFSICAAVSLLGVKELVRKPEKFGVAPIVNARWWTRVGTVGVTSTVECIGIGRSGSPLALNARSSADVALCIRGVNLFGETAYDWTEKACSFIVGTDLAPAECLRLAALTGWNQGKQWQWAVSTEVDIGRERLHKGVFSTEVIYHLLPKEDDVARSVQVKSQLRWEWQALEHLVLRLRLSDRFRTWGLPHRAELRVEAAAPLGTWTVDARVHLLKCRSLALLGYVDSSCRTGALTAHLRLGLFRADHWDDRIYVYEYDAPGSYNAPAYYSRGLWTAGVLSWKISRMIRLYVRASYISYPFAQQKKKPGRAELKLQTVFRF